ncbi:hypothetical protein D3C87_1496170 [compost metagenome]
MRRCMPATSPPAQKPLPLPVSTSARMSRLAVTCSSATISSLRMASLMALRLSGRFRVSTAMPSRTANWISWKSGRWVMSGLGKIG